MYTDYTQLLWPKTAHATMPTCLQLELYCVNQTYNSSTLSLVSCALDLHNTTQVVSRLHATVLGKSNCDLCSANWPLLNIQSIPPFYSMLT